MADARKSKADLNEEEIEKDKKRSGHGHKAVLVLQLSTRVSPTHSHPYTSPGSFVLHTRIALQHGKQGEKSQGCDAGIHCGKAKEGRDYGCTFTSQANQHEVLWFLNVKARAHQETGS